MTSQRDIDYRKDAVRKLCDLSNRVFRIELCVRRHLLHTGVLEGEINIAMEETRKGNLEPLTKLLEGAKN